MSADRHFTAGQLLVTTGLDKDLALSNVERLWGKQTECWEWLWWRWNCLFYCAL